MKKVVSIGAIALAAAVLFGLWTWRMASQRREVVRPPDRGPVTRRNDLERKLPSHAPNLPPVESTPAKSDPGADKAARVEKIKRDYDEITAKVAAEFAAAGKDFPGGLNAYLRQLTLLEREKWKDIAGLLSPQELEDLQMIDTPAGREVQRWIDDIAVPEAQKRGVFRLQKEFDDKWALTFDLTPTVLLARETERQQLQEKIFGVLGPESFALWLQGEGKEYTRMNAFTNQQGFPPQAALELWRAKNALTRERLEIAARSDLTAGEKRAQQAERVAVAVERAKSLLGPVAQQALDREEFAWLQAK